MLTALATAGGVVIGTLLALMRLSGIAPLALFAGGYVNLMRSMPLVLVIFWFYFLVPYIGQWITGAARPIQVGAFWSCLVTFTMFEAAYFCEIVRAGIQSIPRGQTDAAKAIGMTYWQTMGDIILPQAFRNMIPVLLTQTIVLFQDTSLVYVISVTDFLGAASKIAQRDGRLVEMYLFAAAVYFIISLGASISGAQAAAPRRHRALSQVRVRDRDRQCQQVVRRLSGAEGLQHERHQGRSRDRVRPVRLGKIHADQMRQRPRAVPEGNDPGRRHLGRRPENRSAEIARARRHGVPAFRAVSAYERVAEPHDRPDQGARPQRGGSRVRALKLLDRVGLREYADKFPGNLSGGQQQRVAIARALAMDPIAMLFDEPTSALDPEMINEVLDVMVALAKEGMTMMVVTHEMGFARSVANRVIFMDRGEIVEDAKKDDFFGKPRSERAQLFLSKILHH